MTNTQNWQRFVNAHRGNDDGATIARRIGISPATVSRWVSGSALPRPQQATAFAKTYRANPLAALIAADYITAEDIDLKAVAEGTIPDLGEIPTAQLLNELQTRIEDLQELITAAGRSGDHETIVTALQQRHLPRSNVVRLSDHRDNDTLTSEEAAALLHLPHAAHNRDGRDDEAESDPTA